MNGSLARRYARALLALAGDTGSLAVAGEELDRAAATFGTGELRSVVLNPGIPAGPRRAIVERVVGRLALSTTVGNLVRLLADRDRLGILADVARAYQSLVDRKLGRVRVHIRSAVTLTDDQRRDLETVARRLTGGADIVLTTAVEPELLGGVVLDAGGTVYDGSVRSQLARLAKQAAADA